MSTKHKDADPSPLVGEGLGRIAHRAHRDALPKSESSEWERLDHDRRAAWCAAAQAVLSATFERNEA